MDDTVYRKDVIKALEDMSGGYSYIETTTLGAITTIRELPSAQPDYDLSGYSDRLWKAAHERGKAEAQRTGRWKVSDIPKGKMKYCSECGFGQYIQDERIYSYCPHCGAKMEVEE